MSSELQDRPLADAKVHPTDPAIFSYIGKTRPLWEAFFEHLREAHPTAVAEWRYYADGKSWLMKVTKKSKTLCWISLAEGTFRATFYFPTRAQRTIEESDLPQEIRTQFATARDHGKIRGITIVFRKKADTKAAAGLLSLKAAI